MNLLKSFLLIPDLFMRANIIKQCIYKIVNTQIILMKFFLKLIKVRFLTLINESHKCCITIE